MANTRRTATESMEEIHARVHTTRVDRLRKLIDLDFDGVISSMIKADSKEEKRSRSSYISQIQSGHRPFTELAARRIEVDCGKPAGWLDGIGDGELTKKENASARRVQKLRDLIAKVHHGNVDAFLAGHSLGVRRQQFVLDLFEGARSISQKTAAVLEKECRLEPGYLSEA